MIFSRRKFLRMLGGASVASAAGSTVALRDALAQAYPSQLVKWIIYQSAGGLIDTSSSYVGSGYGQWGGKPGNVLLAFEITK